MSHLPSNKLVEQRHLSAAINIVYALDSRFPASIIIIFIVIQFSWVYDTSQSQQQQQQQSSLLQWGVWWETQGRVSSSPAPLGTRSFCCIVLLCVVVVLFCSCTFVRKSRNALLSVGGGAEEFRPWKKKKYTNAHSSSNSGHERFSAAFLTTWDRMWISCARHKPTSVGGTSSLFYRPMEMCR